MAENLKQVLSLPGELLEALGKLKDANAELKKEIKESKAAIKEGKKSGADVSVAEKRLGSMQARSENLTARMAQKREAEIYEAKHGTSAIANKIRGGVGEAQRLASGGFAFGDVGKAGNLMQRAGARLLQSDATSKLGSALAKGGGAMASAAVRLAGLATIGVAVSKYSVGLARGEFSAQKTEAAGTIEINDKMKSFMMEGAAGSSTVTIDKMLQVTANNERISREARGAAARSSVIEWVRQGLGFTASSAALGIETSRQTIGFNEQQLERQFGAGTVGNMPEKALLTATRRRLRDKDWVYSALDVTNYINPGKYVSDYLTLTGMYEALGYGAQAEKDIAYEYKQKRMNEMVQARADKMSLYLNNPAFDLNRLFDRDRKRHIKLYEADRRNRSQFWGAI